MGRLIRGRFEKSGTEGRRAKKEGSASQNRNGREIARDSLDLHMHLHGREIARDS